MKIRLFTLVLSSLILAACSKAPPVPSSECDKVVAHAKKVLGAQAPSNSEMTQQCKAATDEARGCVMQADKPMKILKCDL
ncbi:hypothetical protein PULV_b0950 [Pseudoalteromonas ulvae UL12]|uniref:hypothetical protein n=1 Tax=Pseudoalteromonas ulvae TaxID=107327 RepID=UPI00186B92F1|nr:hypothetical protein [Pseudoalteromonas ulvae]MBE0366195.1 hypothetical protein [Pseudoalteromonas ulvae UL12]